MWWEKLFALIIALSLAFFVLRTIKSSPGSFSAGNISKSFSTMGILALILIAFIALLVLYLKHT